MKKTIICALGISLQTLFAATPQTVVAPSNNPYQSLYDSFIGKKTSSVDSVDSDLKGISSITQDLLQYKQRFQKTFFICLFPAVYTNVSCDCYTKSDDECSYHTDAIEGRRQLRTQVKYAAKSNAAEKIKTAFLKNCSN